MQPVGNSFPTKVHVCVGFDKMKLPALEFYFGLISQAFRFEIHFMIVGQAVECQEPDVVPGELIFWSDVAETGDEVLQEW